MTLREAVQRWRRHDPYVTAPELSDGLRALGWRASPQRIRQLLADLGLPVQPPTRPVPGPPPALRRAQPVERHGRPRDVKDVIATG